MVKEQERGWQRERRDREIWRNGIVVNRRRETARRIARGGRVERERTKREGKS